MRVLARTFLIAFFLLGSSATAQELQDIELQFDKEVINLTPHAFYLIDPTGRLSMTHLLNDKLQHQFAPHQDLIGSFGYSTNAYWFKISLRNPYNRIANWILGVESSQLDYVDVFFRHETKIEHLRSGDRRTFENRNIKHRYPYFELEFYPNEQMVIYIRVRTFGEVKIPISIMTPNYYAAKDHDRQFAYGIFIGILGALGLYYLLLAMGTKNIEFFLYSCFVLSILVFRTAQNGIANEYVWGDFAWFSNNVTIFSIPLVFFTELIFAYRILNIESAKFFRKIYAITIVAFAFFLVGSPFLPYKLTHSFTAMGILINIFITISAFYVLRHGLQSAKYFILSCGAMITGLLFYDLQTLKFLEPNIFIDNCVEIAMVIQVVGFAIAQTDKINFISQNTQFAKNQALEVQAEKNKILLQQKNKLESTLENIVNDLWEKKQELQIVLDSLNHGVAVINENLNIVGDRYSKYMETIFVSDDLSNSSLKELLFEKSDLEDEQKEQMGSVVALIIGEGLFNFAANEHLLPRYVKKIINGRRVEIELDWFCLANQSGKIHHLLLSIRDVTSIRSMKDYVKKKDDEIRIISQISALYGSKFDRFIYSSLSLLEEAFRVLNLNDAKKNWNKVLRDIHTVRGNTRIYGFTELANLGQQLENKLLSIDKLELSRGKVEYVRHEVSEYYDTIREYEYINDKILNRSTLAKMEVALQDVSYFMQDFCKSEFYSIYPDRDLAATLTTRVIELTSSSFQNILAPLVGSFTSIAKQLGKKTPKLIFSGDDFILDNLISDTYENIFVHLIRNSLDHGFSQEQHGEIYIDVTETDYERIIRYSDSGKGLNITKLREVAQNRLGIIDNMDEDLVADLIFQTHISSSEAVSDISGRGIGMDAVRAYVMELGGDVNVFLGDEKSTGFWAFEIRIRIPMHQAESLKLSS